MPDPTPAPSSRHVFVYGTLRRGEERDITLLRPAPLAIGLASVPGVLYHLGAYPGIVLGGHHRVTGEVYAISPELERQLDEIEEVWPQQTGEYSKREVFVQLRSGRGPSLLELSCLLYEINPLRTTGRPVIVSGDWCQGRHGAVRG